MLKQIQITLELSNDTLERAKKHKNPDATALMLKNKVLNITNYLKLNKIIDNEYKATYRLTFNIHNQHFLQISYTKPDYVAPF